MSLFPFGSSRSKRRLSCWIRNRIKAALVSLLAFGLAGSAAAKDITLLNVSYDPTRELYQAVNKAFGDQWKQKKTGDTVTINRVA